MDVPVAVEKIARPFDARPIKDTRGLFITSGGQVISIKVHGSKFGRIDPSRPRFLSMPKSKHGYPMVSINNRMVYVHRLVLETFVKSQPPGLEARHLDGNPENNNIDNLCWGTHAENHQDSVWHGTSKNPPRNNVRGSDNGQSKLTQDDVLKIRANCARGVSQYILAQEFGVTQQTISDIARRKSWRWLR